MISAIKTELIDELSNIMEEIDNCRTHEIASQLSIRIYKIICILEKEKED